MHTDTIAILWVRPPGPPGRPGTVNQRADMARLLDWGDDGIITDDPAILRDLLGERGVALPAKRGR